MDEQEFGGLNIERVVHNAIAADGVDFRRHNREILAEYLRDEGGHEKLVETTFAFIDTHKKNGGPLIRERAHKTEAAICAKVPFLLYPNDIAYLWLEAAEETDGSVRAAIQGKLGTIIEHRFDLVSPKTVEKITKTAIMDNTWLARKQANNNLVRVLEKDLEKEESSGRYVTTATILDQFRQASGHTSPEVKGSILTSCHTLAPLVGPEHMKTLAALIVGPALFDEDPNVSSAGQNAAQIVIYQNPSMIIPIATCIKKMATEGAMESPRTRANYDRTMAACRSGMAALSQTLFQG